MIFVPQPESPGVARETVLVAEDDPIFRRLLESRLQSWGYRVITAEDGTQAWELLQRRNTADLLILDGIMPGVDGIEVVIGSCEGHRTPLSDSRLGDSAYDVEKIVRSESSHA
jgi:PleD family two-component response regulator